MVKKYYNVNVKRFKEILDEIVNSRNVFIPDGSIRIYVNNFKITIKKHICCLSDFKQTWKNFKG